MIAHWEMLVFAGLVGAVVLLLLAWQWVKYCWRGYQFRHYFAKGRIPIYGAPDPHRTKGPDAKPNVKVRTIKEAL